MFCIRFGFHVESLESPMVLQKDGRKDPIGQKNKSQAWKMEIPLSLTFMGLIGISSQSCECHLRYVAMHLSLGEPDPFRMKYRKEIRAIVSHIVSNAMDKEAASEAIKSEVKKLPEQDRSRFTEVVETELLGLHEGNFVRYQIRPSGFSAWKMKWDS